MNLEISLPPITCTEERLRELLSYDPDTGVFTWKMRPNRRIRFGSVAGTLNHTGYRHIKIDGRRYMAHRLAWLYVHGVWPAEQIDHKNGDPSDNRLDNLREATHGENQQNRKRSRNNASGLSGVSWFIRTQKWRAQIQINSEHRHLGYFDTKEEAYAAYFEAKAEHHAFQPTPRELVV